MLPGLIILPLWGLSTMSGSYYYPETISFKAIIELQSNILGNIQLIMNQNQKNSQEQTKMKKKKESQSRDYTCKCGKSYLSYAAAYTHVKNKHESQKQFLSGIIKPDREKLKRGRPKEKKLLQNNTQAEELSVIQESILKIFNILNTKGEKGEDIILEGNQDLNQEQFNVYFQKICHEHQEKKNILFSTQEIDDVSLSFSTFSNLINRHFAVQIGARIKYMIYYYAFLNKGQYKVDDNPEFENDVINEINHLDLWSEANEINVLVIQTFRKWFKIRYQVR